MLILNHNKKDYYDGVVQTTGIDKTIVYDRKQNDNPKDDFKRLPADFVKLIDNLLAFRLDFKKTKLEMKGIYIIAFCGKIYVAWEMLDKKSFNDCNPTSIITYDVEGMKEILVYKTWRQHGNITETYNEIINYDPIKLHRLYNTPIFIISTSFALNGIRESGFVINPTLKTYKFFKIFDSFQALQEIQMFISGVLGTGESMIIEIEDKYKIASHGFDKTSFRKDKGTR